MNPTPFCSSGNVEYVKTIKVLEFGLVTFKFKVKVGLFKKFIYSSLFKLPITVSGMAGS